MPRKAAPDSRPNVVQRLFNEDLLTAAQRMPAGHGAMFRWTRPVSALPPPG